MSQSSSRQALLDACLERAAEILGDLTPHALARLRDRYPDLHARFEAFWPGQGAQLEGQMVEQALYCLMEWPSAPEATRILLVNTAPHHVDTLKIEPGLFVGLIDAVRETVDETIPHAASAERAAWRQVCAEVCDVLEAAIVDACPGAPQA